MVLTKPQIAISTSPPFSGVFAMVCTAWLAVFAPLTAGETPLAPDSSAANSSVTVVPRPKIEAMAEEVDRHVSLQLANKKREPRPISSDATFLRRIYLDLAGRIPSYDESQAFLKSTDPEKRAALIDQLLDSPAYASHFFNYWADILRAKSRLTGGNPGQPYVEYLKSILERNVPYDQFVRELITASGAIVEPGNGAAGFYLRDQGMPEDQMANTVRVFLGTRLECAQCHDHPFDKWTQRDFFEMVAFVGGVETRLKPKDTGVQIVELRRKLRTAGADQKTIQAALLLLRPLTFGVSGSGTGVARLPDSYQYVDGEPNDIVTAKTMFGKLSLIEPRVNNASRPSPARRMRRPMEKDLSTHVAGAQDVDSRTAFADWLTAPDNPRFTIVIANRLWKKLMGVGLIEPVDDFHDDTVASNLQLMEYLAQQMASLDYDMKQYLRVICYSSTYQREAVATDLEDLSQYDFVGPRLRRMSAEQLWDSFLVLAIPDLDRREGNVRTGSRMLALAGLGESREEGIEKLKSLSIEEIKELAEKQVEFMENPGKRREQLRSMMREELREEMIESQTNGPLRTGSRKTQEMLKGRLRGGRQMAADLVRASELPSPAPAGHFLREFGQSDRDQIDHASVEASVPQALSLMNGTIEKRIIGNPRTVLMQQLSSAPNLAAKIDVVYLSMLSRHPTSAERKMWTRAAEQQGEEAATDLIWTLANSNEFLFIQ